MLTLPGVFAPRSDSWLLADQVADRAGPGVRVLDLCTGSGVVGVRASRRGAEVTVVDVSRRALVTASLNAARHGRRLRARRGHLFHAVAAGRFDVIAANPPYVPSPSPELPTRGPSRAWAAGLDGRVLVDEICDRAALHLVPGGELLLVHTSLIGEHETLERLRRGGFASATVVERRTGRLGPLMLEQQRLGTVPASAREEDVLVISARTAAAPSGGHLRTARGDRPGASPDHGQTV